MVKFKSKISRIMKKKKVRDERVMFTVTSYDADTHGFAVGSEVYIVEVSNYLAPKVNEAYMCRGIDEDYGGLVNQLLTRSQIKMKL